MTTNKKLFLSAVSSEFVSYRELLTKDLKRPNLDVAVQEDFIVTGGSTLEKLDTYIRQCDGVVHLIGKATGAAPEERAVAAMLANYPDFGTRLPPLAELLRKPQPGFSYTQWEAHLAIYHQRPLFVYRPTDFELDALDVPRSARFVFSLSEAQSQKEHYQRISALGHDRGQFLNEERLSSAVLRDLVEILPRLEPTTDAGPVVDISRINKYAPAELIGREDETKLLNDAWMKVRKAESPRPHVLTFVALGGEGKTSLVAKWAAELSYQDWPGCDAVFGWSFYSQGTREQMAASSDLFLKEALTFFGDPAMAGSAQGAFDKGRRLAQLVGERRALLILDGVEPLQYPPVPPMDGKLKDDGIAELLKGLAATNHGLCVVTTRYSIPDLRAYWQTTALEKELKRLSREAGVALLQKLGVRKESGSAADFERLVEDVQGHALTLNLLATYLHDAHAGDIRKRDLVKLEEADAEEQGGHAFRVMDAYVRWFEGEGEKGKRAIAVLRLLGLFDRPATADCLAALERAPAIPGLTEALVGMSEAQRNVAFTRLEAAKLLTVNREEGSGVLVALDAHPLLREYFARRLNQQQSEAWRAAHRRLYEHLCATTKEGDQPTLEDLQPLYQAVAHGCQAGLQKEAREKVYRDRILRGTRSDGFYSWKKLGAFGSNLGALACFFEQPWSRVSPALTESAQAWLLNETFIQLRALGRLTESLEPMRAGLEKYEKQDRKSAAIIAGNLSELELTLGEVAGAVEDAEQSVTYADRSGDAFQRLLNRTTHADAMHQAGRRAEAESRFREAEQMQAARQPAYPLLYSLQGFRYCDLLLTEAERAAWQAVLPSAAFTPVQRPNDNAAQDDLERGSGVNAALQSCHAVSERGAKMFEWRVPDDSLLDIALDHLTLGRAALYAAILGRPELLLGPNVTDAQQRVPTDDELFAARPELDAAVAGLRRAGQQHEIPRTFLTRAWLRFLEGKHTDSESAQTDLDEAWEIAERGPMPLFLADIHLYRARLFHAVKPYPWTSPQDDLDAARKLIEHCGYWRRKEELEDAEAAAKNW